ncbi:MAG: GGDEF domain-containing protein, partial [Chloroflexi bacterium]|nr:GGDEF domain-containing protein [Chloroflexota bacterium]
MAAERDRYAQQARSDSLTGLANRVAWSEALGTIEPEMRTSFVAFDVDGLKRINDSAGHAAGDALLVAAADALRAAVRDRDIVARLGGDEFGVLLVGGSEATARQVIDRVREVAAAWQGEDGPYRLTLTAGWAATRPG